MSDDVMGTYDEAEAKCLAAWKRWSEYRHPFMGTEAELRKREAREQEALFQFGNAAALLCWHIDARANPQGEEK